MRVSQTLTPIVGRCRFVHAPKMVAARIDHDIVSTIEGARVAFATDFSCGDGKLRDPA